MVRHGRRKWRQQWQTFSAILGLICRGDNPQGARPKIVVADLMLRRTAEGPSRKVGTEHALVIWEFFVRPRTIVLDVGRRYRPGRKEGGSHEAERKRFGKRQVPFPKRGQV
jgi:hypothetical protein